MNLLFKFIALLTLSFINCLVLAQSVQDSIDEAKVLQHSAPTQAIKVLSFSAESLEQSDDSQFFEHQLLALSINQKLGKDENVQQIISRLEQRLGEQSRFKSWISVLKSIVLVSQLKLEAAQQALDTYSFNADAYAATKLSLWHKFAQARVDSRHSQYESALLLLNEIIPESQQSDSVSVTAGSLALLVNIQYYRREYQKAIESNEQLAKLAKERGDLFYKVFAMSNEMNIYYMMNIALGQDIENAKDENERQALVNLQNSYIKRSAELKQHTLELSREIGAFKIELRALVMSQNQYLSNDEDQLAITTGLQGIKLAEQHGIEYEKAVLYNNLAIVYRSINEHDKGIEALAKAEAIYKKMESEQSLLWVLEDYSIAYQLNKDFEKALDYFQQYHAASQKLLQKTNSKKVIELQEIFDHQKNLNEIERLNQKNTISQSQINAQQTQNVIYLLFGVILMVIIYSVYNRNRIVSSKNKTLDELNHKLREQALRDPLTGLYNRRLINEIKDKISNVCIRKFSDRPDDDLRMGLVLLDIDYFKRINDNFGHSVGDVVIQNISNELTENLRDGDIAIRWGGEEFLVIMFDTVESGVKTFCERFLEQRNRDKIGALGHELAVTVSIGYSLYPFSTSVPKFIGWEDSIKLIDNYLYKAKHQGRNCAVSSKVDDSDLDLTVKNYLLEEFEDNEHSAHTKVTYCSSFPKNYRRLD
jgi:diguanylate cyclase (GGDEF)-like protein